MSNYAQGASSNPLSATEKEIHKLVFEARKTIDELHNSMGDLYNRVAPISAPPKPNSDLKEEKRGALTSLGSELVEIIERIKSETNFLNTITSSLEI